MNKTENTIIRADTLRRSTVFFVLWGVGCYEQADVEFFVYKNTNVVYERTKC